MPVLTLMLLSLLWSRPITSAPPEKVFSTSLVAGNRTYTKVPDVYLGQRGIAPVWSADSATLLFETDGERASLRERRRKVRKGGPPDAASALVRYTVETGQRETLYRTAEGEVLMARVFVGPKADVLFTVLRAPASGDLEYQLYFAPSGGTARPVGPALNCRTPPAVIAAPGQPRALVALTTPDNRLEVYLITPESVRPVPVPGEWQFAQFTTNTKEGTARIAVARLDERQKATGSVFDIDYKTGKVEAVTPDRMLYELPVVPRPLFRADRYRTGRLAREPEPGTAPVAVPPALTDSSLEASYDLDLLDDDEKGPRRLSMARGFVGIELRSPDGLKVAYSTAEGFFLSELVDLLPGR